MRYAPLVLALWLISGLCGALNVGDIGFEADFPVDKSALAKASGISTGMPYTPDLARDAVTRIKAYLAQTGQPYVRVPNPELIPQSAEAVELRFHLYRVLDVEAVELRFTGLRYFSEAKLKELLLLDPVQSVPLTRLSSIMNDILGICHRRGFLFAVTNLDSLVIGDVLTAWVNVREGRVFKPERFYFIGNQHTRDETLLRLSAVRTQRVITPEVLAQAEQNIMAREYISSCVVEPLDESSLLIKVTEGRMTFMEGVVGFNRRNGKTELNGLLRLKFLNLWGSDRSIALNWKNDSRRSELELAYHESGLHNFPLAGDIALQRSTLDTLWVKSGVSAQVYSYYAAHRFGIDLSSQENLFDPSLTKRPTERFSRQGIGAFWGYNGAFPSANPYRGMRARILYKQLHSTSGKRWSGAFEADSENYLRLSRRLVAAAGFHIRDLDDPEAKDFDLYSMGGYNSLRGFRQEEFRSWRLAWAGYEMRYLINPQSRVYLFFDHALQAYRQTNADQSVEDLVKYDIMAVGMGIRMRTTVGILGIEYGLGYRDKRWSNPVNGIIHAGLDIAL